ncbi:Maf family protein [Devosia sp. MC532]|uniref:Maf family protein n=1 Tax=Devosia sp. MC532 TaxID=2799788 RepID=UPI0018F54A6C|nr:Maf family protein [Devosia sp. MC532]MBJ7577190.1 Maf family protein [Devosia sp. MC532]
MLILASTSKTRKSLLNNAGLRFTSHAADVDERAEERAASEAGGDGRDVALLLARRKAEAVSSLFPNAMVIGADQTLALGPDLLHKPSSSQSAADQLDLLRGKTHRLHAGVSLVQNGLELWSHLESAELTMREFTPEERDDVLMLEGEAVLTSVGGYRLEGPSIRLFEKVSGDYFTILGLPLLPLLQALRDFAPELLTPQD